MMNYSSVPPGEAGGDPAPPAVHAEGVTVVRAPAPSCAASASPSRAAGSPASSAPPAAASRR